MCTFCGMYKGLPYRRRPLEDICALIQRVTRRALGTQRVFLADGDVMRRPFHELQTILTLLNQLLPRLTRVSLYANGSSIASKSVAELCALRDLKLHTLYMGLESGDEEILKRCRKGETAARMVEAGILAQSTGLRISVMILLGLGGVDHSEAHISHTVDALNHMQPRLLSALRVVPVPGTELHTDVAAGRFRVLSEQQVVCELRDLVQGLEMTKTVFRANHNSNVIPVAARFPHDKERLLAELQAGLTSGAFDPHSPGRQPLFL